MMRVKKIDIRRIIILILKMCSRARWKVSAGRMWPAGRTLPTPVLSDGLPHFIHRDSYFFSIHFFEYYSLALICASNLPLISYTQMGLYFNPPFGYYSIAQIQLSIHTDTVIKPHSKCLTFIGSLILVLQYRKSARAYEIRTATKLSLK